MIVDETVHGHMVALADGRLQTSHLFLMFVLLNDAKPISIRIFQHDVVGPRGISPRSAHGAETNQALDFTVLVVRIEIQM